jgi:hypothetical protein
MIFWQLIRRSFLGQRTHWMQMIGSAPLREISRMSDEIRKMVDHISRMTDKSQNGRVTATRHNEIRKWLSQCSKNGLVTVVKTDERCSKND